MNNKALLVGINPYPNPNNNLRGCINDIVDMEYFIASKNKVYPKENIKTLTDSRATKKNILAALNWLLSGASAGDQILFQYSGHGAQIPSKHNAIEKDGLDEIICPYDFREEDAAETAISDKEFAKIFTKIPQGVHFVWISDSCHSEDLSRKHEIVTDTNRISTTVDGSGNGQDLELNASSELVKTDYDFNVGFSQLIYSIFNFNN